MLYTFTFAEEPPLLRTACNALPDCPPLTIDHVAALPHAASKLLDQLGMEVKSSATVIFDGLTVSVTATVCGLFDALGSLTVIVAL